jgi:hypothetical protein
MAGSRGGEFMPLRFAPIPQEGLDFLVEAIRKLPPSGPYEALSDSGRRGDLSVRIPHRLYLLGVDAIAAGHGLPAADLVAWRVVLFDRETPLALADLACDGGGTIQGCSGFNSGPFVEQTRAATVFAESLASKDSADYELCTLGIPGLYVWAIWLRSDAGTRDYLIPMYPCNGAVVPASVPSSTLLGTAPQIPYHALSPQDFLQALKGEAEQAIQSTAQRKAGP